MNEHSPWLLESLKKSFDDLDISREGELTREEVGQILSTEGETFEQLMVIILFEKFDQDNSGTINFTEFIDFCRYVNSNKKHDLLRELFNIVDKDQNGRLEISEVRRIAELMGIVVTEDDVYATLTELDRNKDKTVDFDEFCQILD